MPRPDRQPRSSAGQLRHPDRGTRTHRGKGCRGRGHGRSAAWPTAWHSLLPERHFRHGRHPHDRDVQVAGRQCSGAGRLLPGEDGGGGWRAAGQERHLGVRARRSVMGRAVPTGAQSVEPGPFAGRLILRLGGGRCCGLFAGQPGQRYRRLDPRSRRCLRNRWSQADLWPGQPARSHPELFYARSCGTARLDD